MRRWGIAQNKNGRSISIIGDNDARLAKALDKLPIVITLMMVFMAATSLNVAGFNAGMYMGI